MLVAVLGLNLGMLILPGSEVLPGIPLVFVSLSRT